MNLNYCRRVVRNARALEHLLTGAASALRRQLCLYMPARPPSRRRRRRQNCMRQKTGVKVELVFGGSGYVLPQMKLAKQGISTSPDPPITWRKPSAKEMCLR